jgi:hypothetical protein
VEYQGKGGNQQAKYDRVVGDQCIHGMQTNKKPRSKPGFFE